MQQIQGITSQPNQQMTVILPDGSPLVITMLYRESQTGWYFTSLDWNSGQWIENGRRIVTHPNMLRQYENQIPFGLACYTVNNREPTQLQDFLSGASSLFLLTAAEVQEVEALIQAIKNA